jgi:hypothetical protein
MRQRASLITDNAPPLQKATFFARERTSGAVLLGCRAGTDRNAAARAPKIESRDGTRTGSFGRVYASSIGVEYMNESAKTQPRRTCELQ